MEKSTKEIDGYLERRMRHELLKYAVQRAMFCRCGSILDVRHAVLLDAEKSGAGIQVCCRRCWEKVKDRILERFPDIEVTEGWKRR